MPAKWRTRIWEIPLDNSLLNTFNPLEKKGAVKEFLSDLSEKSLYLF